MRVRRASEPQCWCGRARRRTLGAGGVERAARTLGQLGRRNATGANVGRVSKRWAITLNLDLRHRRGLGRFELLCGERDLRFCKNRIAPIFRKALPEPRFRLTHFSEWCGESTRNLSVIVLTFSERCDGFDFSSLAGRATALASAVGSRPAPQVRPAQAIGPGRRLSQSPTRLS